MKPTSCSFASCYDTPFLRWDLAWQRSKMVFYLIT